MTNVLYSTESKNVSNKLNPSRNTKKDTIILGINYYFHDTSACILIDGKLVAAIEDERLTRDKHSRIFPRLSVEKCLELAGIQHHEVGHIAVSIKPTHNLWRKAIYSLRNINHLNAIVKHELIHGIDKQRTFWNWYSSCWPDKKSGPKVHFIEHHLCHAPGSFFVSPYEEAALLGLDGAGEWGTCWLGKGKQKKVQCLGQSYFPHSFGSFYEAVTQFCGFKTNYDEGKVMGLAPLGNPDEFKHKVEKLISIDKDARLKVDLSYFNYQYFDWRRCSDKFYKEFGAPRKKGEELKPHHMHVAAAFQVVLEDKVLQICEILKQKTKARHLVISGGVALNSVMNGRIVRESGFEDLYVVPATGDNGTSIGAAFYLYNGILGHDRKFVHDNPYVGNEYSNEAIKKVLDGYKLQWQYVDDVADTAAGLLAQGNIIGWFQGKMEIGPRALGSRSILACPAFPNMKEKINAEVKFREAFRPFAPSTLVEARKEFFEMDVEDPFMLKVCYVAPDKRKAIPAVTHVDGTARLQTVKEGSHPVYYNLIKRLGEKTGIPVVLNTSFNVMGEPLVESPRDAVRCFFSSGLDCLIIGNYLLNKKTSSLSADESVTSQKKQISVPVESHPTKASLMAYEDNQ